MKRPAERASPAVEGRPGQLSPQTQGGRWGHPGGRPAAGSAPSRAGPVPSRQQVAVSAPPLPPRQRGCARTPFFVLLPSLSRPSRSPGGWALFLLRRYQCLSSPPTPQALRASRRRRPLPLRYRAQRPRRRQHPRRSRRVCSKSRAPRHSPAASHNTAPCRPGNRQRSAARRAAPRFRDRLTRSGPPASGTARAARGKELSLSPYLGCRHAHTHTRARLYIYLSLYVPPCGSEGRCVCVGPAQALSPRPGSARADAPRHVTPLRRGPSSLPVARLYGRRRSAARARGTAAGWRRWRPR